MANDLRMRSDFADGLSDDTKATLGAITALDLSRQKEAAVTDGADPAMIDRAEVGLRQFLALPILFPDDRPFVPTVLVDRLWHELILETVKYTEFCDAAYGGYLHHIPSDERTPADEVDGFDSTLTHLRTAFDPLDDDIWTARPMICNDCMAVLWSDLSE